MASKNCVLHNDPESVLVGLSGGIDSAMALYRLKKAGVNACGATLLLQGHPFSIPDQQHMAAAQDTCEKLGVPYFSLSAKKAFKEKIIGPFIQSYASGKTPSPCVFCNQFIKVPLLLEAAQRKGFSNIATGHYAQKEQDEFGIWHIKRASDLAKDQSYFLSRLISPQIEKMHFPLQDAKKAALIKEATGLCLKPSTSKESMDICFIKNQTYKDLVKSAYPEAFEKGYFISEAGEKLGMHEGYANYTVGQRKGIGLAGGPWYVKHIDEKRNEVTIVKDATPTVSSFVIENFMLNADLSQLASSELFVQTHYRSAPQKARFALHWKPYVNSMQKKRLGPKGTLGLGEESDYICQIKTRKPVLAAPGQVAVVYLGDLVLGSGIICKTP